MKRTRRLKISDYFAVYVLVWSVMPALAFGTIYRVLLLFCAGIWFLLHFYFFSSKPNTLIGMALLLIATFVLRTVDNGSSAGVSWTMNMATYCIVGMISLYYISCEPEKIKKIIIILMAVTAIVSIISIRTAIEDPTALRLATHEWQQGAKSYGAYDFVYMCVQSIPFLFIILRIKDLHNREKLWTIMCFISLLLNVALIIVSGFTLANAIGIIGLLICFAFLKPSIRKTILMIVLVIIVFLSFDKIAESTFFFLLDATKNSPMYTGKINDLYNQIVLKGGVGNSYSDRLSLYKISWEAVFRYPFFGSILWSGHIVGGGHSTYVDILAYGGVLYAFLYYWQMIFFPINLIKNTHASKDMTRMLIAVFLVTSVLTGLFDTITYANAWVWFLLIPYIAYKSTLSSYD